MHPHFVCWICELVHFWLFISKHGDEDGDFVNSEWHRFFTENITRVQGIADWNNIFHAISVWIQIFFYWTCCISLYDISCYDFEGELFLRSHREKRQEDAQHGYGIETWPDGAKYLGETGQWSWWTRVDKWGTSNPTSNMGFNHQK